MPLLKMPSSSTLSDAQFFQIEGPDGILTGFQYDSQQKALYFKESQVIYPQFHGHTHIAEDPVPQATCDTQGLMAPEDKCKLDAMLQTRLGVLGFMGAGFPDDGGWLQGDIILAAGTEFISLERIGNIVRFTVDSPVPLSCACESCASIYWVQDETDISAIRPPTCSGKMPGINGYGELKIYAFPESTLFDPSNPQSKLNLKGNYPSLIFKLYDDGITTGGAEFDMVLQRDSRNLLQAQVGWSMTPGPLGVTECVWFTGKDADGKQMRFDLYADPTPGILGSLLFNGALLTRKMAVITDYTSSIVTSNQYVMAWWDTDNHKEVGSHFTATNVWQYTNPGNPTSGASPQVQILDISIDLLPIGTLVDVFYFQVGEIAGTPINRYYFNRRPELNPSNVWTQVGTIRFGDLLTARSDTGRAGGTGNDSATIVVPMHRTIDRYQWGFTGYDEPLLDFTAINMNNTTGSSLNMAHRAIIDPILPGLRIMPDPQMTGDYNTRPVVLWHRQEIQNAKIVALVGRPGASQSKFSPFDVLLASPIDSYDGIYMRSLGTQSVQGVNCLLVKGAHFRDLPQAGTIRIMSAGANHNKTYRYSEKLALPDGDQVGLLADYTDNTPYPGVSGDVLELLHEDYSGTCVRVEFTPANDTDDSVSVQFKVGTLDMSRRYENEQSTVDDLEDYVRGLGDGYTVSPLYTQSANYTGVGIQPSAVPSGFVCYDGGAQVGGTQSEYWNKLEIMQRDNQVWIWWNGLLVAPSAPLTNALAYPVNVTTPYFPITPASSGRVGFRLWPGASLRSWELRTNTVAFSEFAYGQLTLGS